MNTTNEISDTTGLDEREGLRGGIGQGSGLADTASIVDDEGQEFREGEVARSIERRTAKIPSDVFLWAAGISVIVSLGFEIAGARRDEPRGMLGMLKGRFSGAATSTSPLAHFVGMWVPSLLLLGVYNKLVKVAGSDRSRHFDRGTDIDMLEDNR